MFLRSKIANTRRKFLAGIARRDVSITPDRPLISFTFDDFPQSSLTTGGAILQDAGARGTYYAAPALMNTENHLGQHFCIKDLERLLCSGHELATHTHSHVSARSIGLTNYSHEVEHGYEALSKMLGTTISRHFSYPFGDVTFRVKKTVAPIMLSCRGITPGLNGPVADLNLLRANSLYGDVDQLKKASLLIEENRRSKRWLIFYTHDVRSNPSRFGCTPELLRQVVLAATASGARIATVAEIVSLAQCA